MPKPIRRMRFTDVALTKLKAPPKPKQIEYFDSLTPGFGLRLGYSGSRTWVVYVRVVINGQWKQTRISIDNYPHLSLADARAKAREIQSAARDGKDPRFAKLQNKEALEETSRNTFALVRERFFVQHCDKNMKPRSAKEFRRVLTKYFGPWEHRAITDISKRDVIGVIDAIALETPIMANRCLQYLKTFMNWAADKEIFPANQVLPTARVRKPTEEKEGQRFLSDPEITLLWRVLDTQPLFGPMFKILLLTGQRRNEVSDMPWSELTDLDLAEPYWDIPGERTKNGQPTRVPLSPLVVQILKRMPKVGDKYVFTSNGLRPVSGFSRTKDRIDAAILKIKADENLKSVFEKDWDIHDLRRTLSTHMAELGIARDVVELILNHKSGLRGGVAGIYNRSELLPERRRAFNLWTEHIRSLIAEPKKSKTLLFTKNRKR